MRPRRVLLPLLAQAERLFQYDAESGRITRRVLCGGRCAGTTAGTLRDDGYLSTRFAGAEVLCHRLAWLLHYRAEPPHELDHINTVRSDNRIENLRPASRNENNQNHRQAHSNNRLGVLGVHRVRSGRYLARIRVDSKARHIGVYDTAEEASAAYLNAKRQLHKGNTL